jgi:hypothetical protein
MTSMDAEWGPTNTGIHLSDDYTGTTFDRPKFKQLEEFCASNRQPAGAEGIIELYDVSRFGRILTDGEEDPFAVMEKLKQFKKWGWEVRFVNMQATGDPLLDFIQQGIHSFMAAAYSRKLAKDVRRGRKHFLSLAEGARWLGGPPPVGMKRVDPLTGDELPPRAHAPRGGSLLVANPDELEHVVEGGHMLLRGASYMDIAHYWNRVELRAHMGRFWDNTTVRYALGNPALVGEMRVKHVDPKTGKSTAAIYRAAWAPVIDRAHWDRVQAEIERRARRQNKGPRPGKVSPLRPICGHCGVPYYLGKLQGSLWYRHAFGPSNPEWQQRMQSAGCKHWFLPAATLETAIKDLILQKRTSADFVDHLNAVISDRSDLEESASKRRQAADTRLKQLEREQKAVLTSMTKAQVLELDDKMFWDQLTDLKQQMEELRRERDQALELERVANAAWDTVAELIDETKNLASIWESGDAQKRKEIFDWWVRQVVIVNDQRPGKRRADAKYAVVYLRTAPTEGIETLVSGAISNDEGTVTRTPANTDRGVYVLTLPPNSTSKARAQWTAVWHPAEAAFLKAYDVVQPQRNWTRRRTA